MANKYTIFVLIYINVKVLGKNDFNLKASFGDLMNINSDAIWQLQKGITDGQIVTRDGSLELPEENNLPMSKLLVLVNIINEIMNEGLSDMENEVISNTLDMNKNEIKSKSNGKNNAGGILDIFRKNNSTIPRIGSDDVAIAVVAKENEFNTHILSKETDNSTFFNKHISEIKKVPLQASYQYKAMENKWNQLLKESINLMEENIEQDIRTIQPLMNNILNKNLLSPDFHLREYMTNIDGEQKTKENMTSIKLNKGFSKLNNISNKTMDSLNMQQESNNNFKEDDLDNVLMFDDLESSNLSSMVEADLLELFGMRRGFHISADAMKKYARTVNKLKKHRKRKRQIEANTSGRNLKSLKLDPNYNEDNFFWEPTPTNTRRIYQGTPTRITDFPFVASIHMFQTLQCSGAIIKSDLVLTAASCLQIAWNNRFFRENPRMLQVRVGSTRYFGGGEVIEVAEVYFHPHYKPRTLTANLAIIRLYRNLRFSNSTTRYVVKIKYDREEHHFPDDQAITLVGFGAMRASNKLHHKGFGKLQYAVLPIYPITSCREMYTKDFVTNTNFCAGLMSQGSGACNHDVGDPAVSEGVVVGVVSFGSPICGRVDTPTVFTKVGMFKDWIDEIMQIKPVVYNHATTTTNMPVPLEPDTFATTVKTSPKPLGRNKEMVFVEGQKPETYGRTPKSFRIRPMTKAVDVQEYFSSDPSRMGKKREKKLRQGLKGPEQNPMDQRLDLGAQVQSGFPQVPFGMEKVPFGMDNPLETGIQQQEGIGMLQQPGKEKQQQEGERMQQQPGREMPQQEYKETQLQEGREIQQQEGKGIQQQMGREMQLLQGRGMAQQEDRGMAQQEDRGMAQQEDRVMAQQKDRGMAQQEDRGMQLLQGRGMQQLGYGEIDIDIPTSKFDTEQTPALFLYTRQGIDPKQQKHHTFIPADCNDSDIEGTGAHAALCGASAVAAALAASTASPINNDPGHNIAEINRAHNDYSKALRLTNANSEEIDNENKVSSLIETILEPSMQEEIRQGVYENKEQNEGGAQKLKDIDTSIFSMLYVSDNEDNNKKDTLITENNDSGFKDYIVPRKEGMAVPDFDESVHIRATEDNAERNFNINPPNQAVGNEEGNNYNFGAYDPANQFGSNQPLFFAVAAEDKAAEVVTNIPRYRPDLDSSDDYYLERAPLN